MKVQFTLLSTVILSLVFAGGDVAVGKAIDDCKSKLGIRSDDTAVAVERLRLLSQKRQKGEPYVIETIGRASGNNSYRIDLHEREKKLFTGIPRYVRKFDHSGVVFRHYTNADYYNDKSYVQKILSSGQLMSGYVPYIRLVNGFESYEDLTGIFLTLPNVSASAVGLDSSVQNTYVDLIVPEDVPVLELQPNEVYLIPLPKTPRPWMIEDTETATKPYFINVDIVDYSK